MSPRGSPPPLVPRDLPKAVPLRRMIGPSILLAGLSLGSGEFVIWPHIVYKAGFVFAWACFVGVATQYFLNMEIERWTLATGETVTTGFLRLSPWLAPIFLVLNVVPWAWPGWATGAGTLLSWLVWGPDVDVAASGEVSYSARHGAALSIAGLLLVGVILTAGPVVYRTVEKIQAILLMMIASLTIGIGVAVIRPDAVAALGSSVLDFGAMPDAAAGLSMMTLLGALAFAGAGGTTNLGQSHFIRDKGYGMGRLIGRITSPLTGVEEASADVGYLPEDSPVNRSRWRVWWRNANAEHALTFLLPCVACLAVMMLISYSVFYDESGAMRAGLGSFGSDLGFIWAEANGLADGGAATR